MAALAQAQQEQGHELPPGFRFYPTEEELVSFYLLNKLEGKRQASLSQVIPVVDICSTEPWDLPKLAGDRCKKDTEQWFFFTPRQEREARGGRPSRTTAAGYWKATGSPGYVYSSDNRVIGVKKTMVFYKGKAPTGRKTKWKMNEYRAIEAAPPAADSSTSSAPKLRHEFSVCRVYVVSGSSRAFDRRPLQGSTNHVATRETSTRLIQQGETSSHQDSSKMVERDKTSSTETSNSGGENVNWGMVDALVNPSWDWELTWP